MNKAAFAPVLFVLLLPACRNSSEEQQQKKGEEIVNRHLVDVNRILTRRESGEIDEYIARHGWEMKMTGTGLRYSIYKEGKGKKPASGENVKVRYTLSLIDGTVVSKSKPEKPFSFKLGEGAAPSGLEEGLLMMKEGSAAKLILPSHLGYGLTGDKAGIPPKAVLIYDVELINITK
jgi:FKBP-type peptidyl-prolyl cis-trans isomerase FkpA